jgi:hypothetical protein
MIIAHEKESTGCAERIVRWKEFKEPKVRYKTDKKEF